MGLADRDYMRSRGNSGHDPERKDNKISGRKTVIVVIAVIMILVFIFTYLI